MQALAVSHLSQVAIDFCSGAHTLGEVHPEEVSEEQSFVPIPFSAFVLFTQMSSESYLSLQRLEGRVFVSPYKCVISFTPVYLI